MVPKGFLFDWWTNPKVSKFENGEVLAAPCRTTSTWPSSAFALCQGQLAAALTTWQKSFQYTTASVFSDKHITIYCNDMMIWNYYDYELFTRAWASKASKLLSLKRKSLTRAKPSRSEWSWQPCQVCESLRPQKKTTVDFTCTRPIEMLSENHWLYTEYTESLNILQLKSKYMQYIRSMPQTSHSPISTYGHLMNGKPILEVPEKKPWFD